jgi:fatty-acyl-CoA synthase
VTIRSIFDWAETTPDKTALEHNGEAWSYRALAEAIAIARGYFHRRGITGEGVAVMAVTHLRDFWVFSLALRSLGLTTIAVQSPDDLAGLRLPNVRCVVASAAEDRPGMAERCAEQGWPLILVGLDGEAPLGLDRRAGQPEGGHILRTSGTTGEYKMVLFDPSFEPDYLRLRRAASGMNQHSVANLFEFGAWTGVGYKAPMNAWTVGATVMFHQGLEPHLALRRPGLTSSTVIPASLAVILAQPEGAFPRSETMNLSVIGGTITQGQIDQAKARITPRLFNGLGATESHPIADTPLDTPDDHRWHLLSPGSLVELVDEFDKPVPVGQIGRIRVGTEGGPTSYLYDEEATKAFFRDGFFYTGDLAVMREDGRIALQGRVTEVINVDGHKISPAPIEDRLREALGVDGVCLLSMQDDHGEEELHLVIEATTPVDTATLANVLRAELRGFPGVHVQYRSALPRNAMGKVLRQALTVALIAARRPR